MVSKDKLLNFLNKIHLPHWLLILLAVVLVLRIPSFFEPYSYGDEMIYLSLGEGIRQNQVLYKDLHDNKPPLLYITAAISGNLFWFKAILAFWSLITIVLFWKLSKALFKDKKITKISTIIFALLSTLPLLEGNIANAENFMIGTTIAAFLIIFTKKLNPKNLFFAGMFFSLSTLFKVPAAFEVPVIIVYWLVIGGLNKVNFKKVINKSKYLLLGFVFPISLTFVWYFLRGGFKEYVFAGFLQNIGYLSAFRPGDIEKSFFLRNLPLFIRAGVVLLATGITFVFRKKLSKQFILLTLWLVFSLFAVTLSERPYPHYLLQSVPAFSLLLALFLVKTKKQIYTIFPIAFAIFVPFFYHFWHYSTTAYYSRFLKFLTRKTTAQQYFESFGDHIPRSYEIAGFINKTTIKKDKVLVWGPNNSIIYALSRRLPPIRFVAQYHINDFSSFDQVLEEIKINPPKLFVILPEYPVFGELIPFLSKNYVLIKTIDGAQIWSLVSPQVKAALHI